jgi:geranylgeranyl diphosphate synthase type I
MRDFEAALERTLGQLLARRRAEALEIDPRLGGLVDELSTAVAAGGKRMRPQLLAWGYRAAGGEVDQRVVQAGAALELLHTFALIQDDVMDRSLIRRGRPASHVILSGAAELEPERFGPSAAVLLADLALIWADQALTCAGFESERLSRGLEVYDCLRTEVTLGQYLDVLAAHSRQVTEADALTVNRYKTASYTVQRPIQLGMALAGATETAIESVPAYAIPAGIAFQLRDDVLGAFGDPAETGKPSGQDLLERKPTWLRARLLGRCPEAAGLTDVDRLRGLIVDSGTLADAEAQVRTLAAEALAAARRMLVPGPLLDELVALTERLIWRRA